MKKQALFVLIFLVFIATLLMSFRTSVPEKVWAPMFGQIYLWALADKYPSGLKQGEYPCNYYGVITVNELHLSCFAFSTTKGANSKGWNPGVDVAVHRTREDAESGRGIIWRGEHIWIP